VMTFISSKENLRVLPAQHDAVKALLTKAAEAHVAHFTQESLPDPKEKTLFDLTVEVLRGLPPLTHLFRETASGGSISIGPGGSITESEATRLAVELSEKEKISFTEALSKVCKANKIIESESDTVRLE